VQTASRSRIPAGIAPLKGHLVRCQRRVSRRKKGSTRRAKAVAILAKAHRHVGNQRRDFQHKGARKLVQQYDGI
jgi:putative transposase